MAAHQKQNRQVDSYLSHSGNKYFIHTTIVLVLVLGCETVQYFGDHLEALILSYHCVAGLHINSLQLSLANGSVCQEISGHDICKILLRNVILNWTSHT